MERCKMCKHGNIKPQLFNYSWFRDVNGFLVNRYLLGNQKIELHLCCDWCPYGTFDKIVFVNDYKDAEKLIKIKDE